MMIFVIELPKMHWTFYVSTKVVIPSWSFRTKFCALHFADKHGFCQSACLCATRALRGFNIRLRA